MKIIGEQGELIEVVVGCTRDGDPVTATRIHPAVRLREDAKRSILKWHAEFGLTPASAARVKTRPISEEKKDSLEAAIDRQAKILRLTP